ncbi:hypothetical protein BKA70DRAFT_1291138 [Coprinopsis sp. MPI-PUGE-AT-0042]|nr:hypothetical protein BKA70DRAFT_1291138 [Coprinopsis sp. MPI-PUGE-AT-0042]
MEYNTQELGSPSFLIVVSSSLAPSPWNPESPSASKAVLSKSVFLAAEQFPLGTPRDEPSQGTDACRSQDEAAAIAPGRTSGFQGVPHSPQTITEAENMAPSLSAASFPSASTMENPSPNPPPAVSVTDVDLPRSNPTRVVPRCDTDTDPSPAPSSPPRSYIPSGYQSAAAEAISRFRPNHRDVIIGLAPHLFDERAKRPGEAPRSNVPLSYYNESGRLRPSPLRYTIDYDEEEEKVPPLHVKPKKSLVSRLAEDFVFGEDSSKSTRTRVSSSSLIGGSHRASIIDINLDGPPKSKRAKSSPNIKSSTTAPASVPTPPPAEPEKPPSRLKRWTSFKFGNGGDGEKPKAKPKKPKAEEDCGICYPRCYGECGQITFAQYDRKERRERRARAAASKKAPAKGYRDFRDSPEWKEFREAQAWTSRMETEKEVFGDRPSTARSKSESNLKDRYEPTVTVVKAVNDSPDSTPEESPSSSSEDVSVVHGADKDKFRWRSLPGIGNFMVKVKSPKPTKAL